MPITTVLLDLDDTLLRSNTNAFVQAYLLKLGQSMSQFGDPNELIAALMHSVGAMQANTDPAITNHQAFYDDFLPKLTGDPIDIHAAITAFYKDIFPTLRPMVEPISIARPLVEHLLATKNAVVVATNPIFPAAAITQRMDWAGVLDVPFSLVTTMENMATSKPNPQYYRDILAQVNASPQEAMMVGDSAENDIAPAAEVGLQTWHIAADNASPLSNYHGSLAEFFEWVKETE